ncbi:MAG: LamG-like jellyroll fold domain-containing protein [Spirochaetota bacterium]
MIRILSLFIMAGVLSAEGLLIHWKFDESASSAKDSSGNGIDGAGKAQWVDSPSGKAFFFDGTSAGFVSAKIPEDKRFGTKSWTFSAWVKPKQFTIEDKQNQRRIFAYGTYPDAYLVIDIFGTGTVGNYFVFKNEAGKNVSAGGGTSMKLTLEQWSHVALVCDRSAQSVVIYINGQPQGDTPLPPNFTGNFSVNGDVTVGSGWHNYWGAMDEVKVFTEALSREAVRAEFNAMKGIFGISESAESAAIDARETAKENFAAAANAWAQRNFSGVRDACRKVIDIASMPAHFKSYAHLRIAQSFAAERNTAAAKAEYAKIQANASYPDVHRYEAGECIRELERTAKGLPSYDPGATRTKITSVTAQSSVYVAPNGSDENDGSEKKPFATLAKARDAVRAVRQKGDTAIAVMLKGGEYKINDTLALTAEDGSEKFPTVYKAEKKGTAVLYGGARLSGFKPVSDASVLERLPAESRGKVMQCDLKALGITDHGELKVRGFGQPPSPPTLELFFNEKPMTLARWPNEGFVPIKKLTASGDRDKGVPSVIEYDDERHARWTKANDIWLFGYFKYLWADATIKIAAIDTAAKTLTSAEAYKYGGTGMDTKQGIIYYAFNLLEEIDAPGEWYLDRESGTLYFYPPTGPSDIAKAKVEIGLFSKPMITMDKVKNVRFDGITLDCARFNAIAANASEDCIFAGLTIKRFAGSGITVNGGSRNTIIGCDVHTMGRRATEVIGGDRARLIPGGHVVENCRIYDFGRIDRTYTPAIQLEGVGNRVAHNLMYDCPSSVMRIEGNDHIIEYNQVHSAVQESDDQGAMENFANPTYRGVVFRYNHFYNNGKSGKEAAMHGQAAIRFDDAISGMLVYGNIFYKSANGHFGGVQMNSGRDNIIDNNIFADCRQGVSGGWGPGNNVWKQIREGKKGAAVITDDLYLSRYPAIKWMLDEPAYNNVWRNVFYQCGRIVTGNRANLDMLENGVFTNTDPGFVNAANGDLRLKPDAPLFASVGFRPIPIEAIGLYQDEYRASWPVNTTPVKLRDWREMVGVVKVLPHPMAPIPVKKASAAPVIDGTISSGEWQGETLKLRENTSRGALNGPAAAAKVMHDGRMLYLAIRIPLTDLAKMKQGTTWGRHDGLEICMRDENNLAVGRRSPTYIVQGFTGGQSQGAGNPEEEFEKETKALGTAAKYGAMVDGDFWSAEWAIPIGGMGISYAPKMRLQFNIGIRRSDTDDWIALAGAMGANFILDNAAVIVLE